VLHCPGSRDDAIPHNDAISWQAAWCGDCQALDETLSEMVFLHATSFVMGAGTALGGGESGGGSLWRAASCKICNAGTRRDEIEAPDDFFHCGRRLRLH
jgi:hypothetical protein